MKFNKFIIGSAVLSFSFFAFFGCENKVAIKALEDATTQLSENVKQQNLDLDQLTKSIEACKTEIANVTQKPVVVTSEVATFEAPAMDPKVSVANLEAYKKALTEVIEKQKTKLTELQTASENCTKELETAKASAEALAKEAEAKAAAAKASVKKSVKTAPKTMEQELKSKGEPTTGARSRFK